ncbi:MAG: LuxR C-terminal-related transcriptional regulator [Sediminibacterium sp.]
MLPYLIFVLVFVVSGKLAAAKNLLVVPVLYALWVIITLVGAVRSKYSNDFSTASAKEEMAVTFFSLTPWVGLPIIDYFNFGQQIEAATTNTGFLLLLSLQMKQHITKLKNERQRLVESEENLRNWNEKLKDEVEKRTKEIEQISMEQRIKESCARYGLTPRETQISVMICRGQSYKQIAEKLYISERTATKHAQNIFDKTKVSNKLELLNKLNITATG